MLSPRSPRATFPALLIDDHSRHLIYFLKIVIYSHPKKFCSEWPLVYGCAVVYAQPCKYRIDWPRQTPALAARARVFPRSHSASAARSLLGAGGGDVSFASRLLVCATANGSMSIPLPGKGHRLPCPPVWRWGGGAGSQIPAFSQRGVEGAPQSMAGKGGVCRGGKAE